MPQHTSAPNLSGLTLLLGNQVVGGTTATGEVTISGPATQHGGQPVTFNLDPTNTGNRIATVYVPVGSTSTTFSVTFKTVTKNTTSTIWANSGNNGGATLSYPVTVTPAVAPPPPPTVTLSSVTLSLATVASGGSLTATVNLTGAAPSGGAVVTLSVSPAIAGLPASVTVSAGSTAATVAITAPTDAASTTYTVTGTYGTSANVSFVVEAAVPPPPPTPPVISITSPAAGATISGTIIASANATDAQGIASVQWELDGTTSLGTDTSSPYTESINTANFANGTHTITAIAKDVAGLTTTSSGVAVTINNAVTPPPPPPSGSLASGLGTPSFSDTFNYTSSSETSFLANWVPQIYTAKNYAGAGSNVSMVAANITFPVDPNLGVPCLCLTLNQGSSSASTGGEILSAASLFASTGLGGYGTYEFYARFGSTSTTPTGSGSAVSGSVSSTFMLSQSNGGTTGYVEIDAPEVEGQHATWAEYDIWYNSDSGGNVEPSGGNFVSQGAGNDSYLVVPNLATGFNYLGFVWSSSSINFYLNGVLQGSLTTGVPQAQTAAGNIPGIDINHYGCNSSDWGGSATVGTNRYFYVQSAKYWKA
jgi:Bacterial Ig domain/Glycosyl hydrolases family 16